MSKIPYIQLKDLCTVNQGLQIPISKRFKSNGENRYFYITVQFLKESHNEKHYVENPPKSSICKEDDIIVVRTGSTGKILTGIKGCFHNNFFKVNYDKKKVVGKYLYYCLKSKEKQKEMKNRSGITTIPDLNHFMFLDMKIPLPSYSNQLKIVEVLDNINSKIEINNKINAELEAMAKTLYDYWFVQFDFPDKNGKPYKSSEGKMIFNEELKREIPVGWESGVLSDIANITMGQSPSGSSYNEDGIGTVFYQGSTDFGLRFPSVRKYTTEPSRMAEKNDILLSVRAPVGTLNQAIEKCCIGRGLASLREKEGSISFLWSQMEYFKQIFDRRNASGTTFGSITKDDLFGLKLCIPDKEVLDNFKKIADPFHDKIIVNSKQNQKLSELRDWLLPMLMNGQVSVGEK
ncbi:restriction endonuclease subunit S [Tenacibaculum piscium]|uniref:restriction endonuclease subunit S n=1 Tax=Tenacibaculum piscium TaxID=1458515 RepID=UPI001F32D8AF|nr:restriction endonuclease subunit S [Tenacibaculum piscium]